MSLSELFRWAILVAIIVTMVFFVFMAYTTHDEMVKASYIAMFAGALFALGSALDAMGFFGKKSSEHEVLDKMLREIYSPIHAMITDIEHELGEPIQDRSQHTFVSLANYDKLSQVFRQYNHVLGDRHLKMWLSIENEIKMSALKTAVAGFVMDQERQNWFDELEREYRELVKELTRLRAKA